MKQCGHDYVNTTWHGCGTHHFLQIHPHQNLWFEEGKDDSNFKCVGSIHWYGCYMCISYSVTCNYHMMILQFRHLDLVLPDEWNWKIASSNDALLYQTEFSWRWTEECSNMTKTKTKFHCHHHSRENSHIQSTSID